MAEAGLPGFEVLGIFAVLAPAGTPREIVERLNSEIVKALRRADINERFAAQALDPAYLSVAQFSDYIKAEATRWGKLIKEAGIK
jgi:tripartite-type tricarboxylate transporter receptor subunit TctC